ncbi:hypothetical protein BS47DRAFT_984907 [Hydnum rufescens UP504]|uniref:Uncharacterized protein n=1 Tax=Hydnum rufescens UP504 TaxID=1448309 RepID=A0A9P6DWV8_9AGAM|nr:hypothetical protein BS47DRAFT_984907 [Hydnum rufescens UP504]
MCRDFESCVVSSKIFFIARLKAPALTHNLVSLLNTGKIGKAVYDGYTSCPLLMGMGN